MTYYLTAYALFWAALFGYLMGLSSRQAKLNERAARLRERLASRGEETT
ncbi:MAG: CcmD family protein [Gemmatimonadota bacterium]|nr:CcmD family protein [Gemmatimonadota bacterium]